MGKIEKNWKSEKRKWGMMPNGGIGEANGGKNAD